MFVVLNGVTYLRCEVAGSRERRDMTTVEVVVQHLIAVVQMIQILKRQSQSQSQSTLKARASPKGDMETKPSQNRLIVPSPLQKSSQLIPLPVHLAESFQQLGSFLTQTIQPVHCLFRR